MKIFNMFTHLWVKYFKSILFYFCTAICLGGLYTTFTCIGAETETNTERQPGFCFLPESSAVDRGNAISIKLTWKADNKKNKVLIIITYIYKNKIYTLDSVYVKDDIKMVPASPAEKEKILNLLKCAACFEGFRYYEIYSELFHNQMHDQRKRSEKNIYKQSGTNDLAIAEVDIKIEAQNQFVVDFNEYWSSRVVCSSYDFLQRCCATAIKLIELGNVPEVDFHSDKVHGKK